MTERAAALGRTRRAAAFEYIADLSTRTRATVDRAAAAIRPDAAAARSRSAGPRLTAAAAAGLHVTDLPGAATTAISSHAASVGHCAALDLGFFAEIGDGHAALAASLADATAAAHAALEHLAAAIRDASAYDALIVASFRDAGLWLRGCRARIVGRIAARVSTCDACVCDAAYAGITGDRQRAAAASCKQPQQRKR